MKNDRGDQKFKRSNFKKTLKHTPRSNGSGGDQQNSKRQKTQ